MRLFKAFILISFCLQLSHAQKIDLSDDNAPKCEIGLKMENDFMVPPAGLLTLATNPYDTEVINPNFDKGYTAALFLDFSYQLDPNTGKELKLILSSQLFTGDTGKPAEIIDVPHIKKNGEEVPTLLHHVFFTEENRLRAAIKKPLEKIILKDHKTSIEYGINAIHLNNHQLIPGGIASIQQLYHRTVDGPGQPQYEYYEDGERRNRINGSLDCMIDVQKNITPNIKYGLGAGASVGTLKGLNHFIQQALMRIKLPVSKRKPRAVYFDFTEEAYLHHRGIEFRPGIGISYESPRIKIENNAFYRFGNSYKDYVNYDEILRPVTSIAIFFKLD